MGIVRALRHSKPICDSSTNRSWRRGSSRGGSGRSAAPDASGRGQGQWGRGCGRRFRRGRDRVSNRLGAIARGWMGGPSGPFWKYDRTAETAMSEGRPILGGLWTLGKLDTLVLRDARYSIGWFDALAHEGVHILSGKLLWPLKSFIHNNQTGALLFGWVRFVEEFAAYNVGHLAVGRLHGLGPMAAHGAFRSISNRPIHVISTFVVFPFEVVGGVYIFRKYHSHR